MTQATATEQGRLSAREKFLTPRGWALTANGLWAHPKLGFPWPGSFAVMLEREADEGDDIALALLERDR